MILMQVNPLLADNTLRLGVNVPFYSRCPYSRERRRKQHDRKHFRDSNQNLAVLRVVDTVVACVNSPHTL